MRYMYNGKASSSFVYLTKRIMATLTLFIICGIFIILELNSVLATYCSYQSNYGLTSYKYCSYSCCGTYYYRYCCSSYYYYYYYSSVYYTVSSGVIAGAVIGSLIGVAVIVIIVVAIAKTCKGAGSAGVTIHPRSNIAMVTTTNTNPGGVMHTGIIDPAPTKSSFNAYPDQPYPPPQVYDTSYPPQHSYGYPTVSPGQVMVYPPSGTQAPPPVTSSTMPPPYGS